MPVSTSRRLLVLGAAVLAVLVVVFLLVRAGGEEEGSTVSIEHVHGLGMVSGDGGSDETLYAATHHGLLRLGEGEPELVAERVQDFMGFTVAGPDRFLASGHPGEGQDGPGSVGLIESTDGGETWEGRSLGGEADFHSLEYRHDSVYGLDAMTGALMVSQDLRSWDSRSQLPLADFAVSPDDADVLVATTREGLARSEDGGRSFDLDPEAPLMLLVSWADDGTLVGVTPEGSLYVRDGSAWQERGSLAGQPQALLAVNDTDIYAATEAGILASDDGGSRFDVSHPAG